MSDSSHADAQEFETLCLAAAQGSLSDEQLARLEQLLLDNPELQELYCRNMSLNTLLRAEFGLGGQTFAPLMPAGQAAVDDDAVAQAGCVTLAQRIDEDFRQRTSNRSSRVWSTWSIGLSAALAFVLVSAILFSWLREAEWRSAASRQRELARAARQRAQQEYYLVENGVRANLGAPLELTTMELRSPRAIGLLHRVTNTSWDGAQDLEPVDEGEAPGRMDQGAAQLAPFNGRLAGGYVIALPPGASLDLMVDADSFGENALAVMELDPAGLPTGGLVSFSNQGSGETRSTGDYEAPVPASRVYGRLGNWSENNDTQVTKYFLLAGVHKQAPELEDHSWYVTDYLVFVDEPDLIYIGWDDSGWRPRGASDALRDNDYNDVTAAIRIRPNARLQPRSGSPVRVIPELDDDGKEIASDDQGDGYAFEVAPRTALVLGISSEASSPNSVAVVQRDSGRIWWQRDNLVDQNQHLGVFVIENHGDEPLQFLLVGKHQNSNKGDPPTSWGSSKHRVVLEAARCQTIGFEDSGNAVHEEDGDWNDIQVSLHWLPL